MAASSQARSSGQGMGTGGTIDDGLVGHQPTRSLLHSEAEEEEIEEGRPEVPPPVQIRVGRQFFILRFSDTADEEGENNGPAELLFIHDQQQLQTGRPNSSRRTRPSIRRFPLDDILWISAAAAPGKQTTSGRATSSATSETTEANTRAAGSSFLAVIHTFSVNKSASTEAVQKRRGSAIYVQFADAQQRSDWTTAAQRVLNYQSRGTAQRPQLPILILVNPFGGKKKAPAILERVRPIFDRAELPYHVIETERAGHALDFARMEPLISSWSSIVTISGDGLFYEVLNGIMQRSDWRQVLDQVSLGMIPGGSGNGLAASLRNTDPVTAAFCIAKGWERPLDLIRVMQSGEECWAFLSVNWAMISDIDFESEAYRWMGGARFTVAALARVLNLRRYSGRIQFTTAPEHPQPFVAPEPPSFFDFLPSFSSAPPRAEDNAAAAPRTQCGAKCTVCCSRKQRRKLSASGREGVVDEEELRSADAWTHELDGQFLLTCGLNVSHISSDAYIAPYAHLADGTMDLILIPRGANKAELTSWLIGMEEGTHLVGSKIQQYYKVTRFSLIPDEHMPGQIALDGERTPNTPVDCRILPAALRLIGAQ